MSNATNLTAQDYVRKILLSRIYDVVRVTPLQKLETLSERLKCDVLLKREDYQKIHSFKIRGAYFKMKNLTEEQRQRGVIAASAGNHAQGVALSASRLKCRAVIVMPETTPDLKIDAVRRLGGEVVLHGESFNDAYDYAINLALTQNMTLIPPYDDPDVIAGQGTIAHEIIGQCDNIDTVYIPVGGGGLAAGMSVYIKSLLPKVRVIGVEAEGSACMLAALKAHSPCDIGFVSHFADGVAVCRAGDETYRLCSMFLDDIVTCSNDEICAAMKDIYDDTRAIAEPSGALSLAGLKKHVREHNLAGNQIAIMSGANVKFRTLRMVAERCDVGEMTEGMLSVEIPETKGSFLKFCNTIGERHVTEFSYRICHDQKARVLASVELSGGRTEMDEIVGALRNASYNVTDLTDDVITKDHVRYMVGGHPMKSINEKLFLFEFPNTKHALINFLTTLGDMYSITLFHFRIADLEFCSVLCGFNVDKNEQEEGLEDFIRRLGYPVTEVSSNPAYRDFLA